MTKTDGICDSIDLPPKKVLEEILSRLNGVCELVETELAEYQISGGAHPIIQSKDFLLSVVIPVYNEKATIGRVLSRIAALPLPTEIIVVDDCSTDGTRQILQRLDGIDGIRVILKDENAGKGAALRTGFEIVSGNYVVIQDADLEYDPRDILHLLPPLLSQTADVVYGSRLLGSDFQHFSWMHRQGNKLLTGLSNLVNGIELTDMETCYKAFTREAIDSIEIQQSRFGVEPEITSKLARRRFRFAEVPISYHSRSYNEGKKIGIGDLFSALYCIVRYGITD